MKNLGILLSVVVCNLWLLSMINNYPFKFFTSNNYDNNINNNYNHPQLFVKHGKWMRWKRHNQTCDFIPENMCCKKTQNLHFEFRNRKLNKIDAVEELRKILKNKKLLLTGDSLMLEFYRGLAELLHVMLPVVRVGNFSGSIQPPGGGTVTFLGAGVILLQGCKGFAKLEMFTITSEKTIRKKIADHDIVFFNQGLHYGGKLMLEESIIYFNSMGKMLHGKNV